MKIEKVNENQIRCTLTKEDLRDRQLKISELAYGSEKAKSLFQDMMQQASNEFGFEAENIPLMIEAIPISADCIVLIITKVENPDELDTRFSKFSPSEDEDFPGDLPFEPEGADMVLDLFQQITKKITEKTEELAAKAGKSDFIPLPEALKAGQSKDSKDVSEKEKAAKPKKQNLIKAYTFTEYDQVSRLARVLNGYYKGKNSLYKDPKTGIYTILMNKSSHTPQEFNKVCNICSEYGSSLKYLATTKASLDEHQTILIPNNALQVLSEI